MSLYLHTTPTFRRILSTSTISISATPHRHIAAFTPKTPQFHVRCFSTLKSPHSSVKWGVIVTKRMYSTHDAKNDADKKDTEKKPENDENGKKEPHDEKDTNDAKETKDQESFDEAEFLNVKQHRYGHHPSSVRFEDVKDALRGDPIKATPNLPHDRVNYLQLLLQHRYAIFTIIPISSTQAALVQLVSNQVKYAIILQSVCSCLALIALLYLILQAVERFRRRHNITAGSLQLDSYYAVYGIIGICTIVFLSSPLTRNFIYKRASYLAGEVGMLPALTATFCHTDLFHLAFNMIALNSFGPVMGVLLGPEHFLWAFLSGAVLGCIATTFADLLFLQRQMICVGASGGLYFILGMFSQFFPDQKLSIIFLPWFSFSVQDGIIGLFLFDIGGLALQKMGRGSRFGHAAHLGGLIGGILYANYGATKVWRQHGPYPNVLLTRAGQVKRQGV